MKSIIKSVRLSAAIVILLSIVCFNTTKAQTIDLNTIFTEDEIIYPFSHYDIIYGLTITGSVELLSDTSMVRVILSDQDGNEWMVYEAYSLILPYGFCDLSDTADETKYLQVMAPLSIEIQLIQAELTIKYIHLETESSEGLESMQEVYKAMVETRKVDSINYSIDRERMIWFAERNPISDLSYTAKASLFGHKYNMLGMDYYSGGIFDPYPSFLKVEDTSDLVSEFDWRKRHDAIDTNSFYFDGNDYANGAYVVQLSYNNQLISSKLILKGRK